jgi:hypothetical protein
MLFHEEEERSWKEFSDFCLCYTIGWRKVSGEVWEKEGGSREGRSEWREMV